MRKIRRKISRLLECLKEEPSAIESDDIVISKSENYLITGNCINTRKGAIRRWFRVVGFGRDEEGEFIEVSKERNYIYRIDKEDFLEYIKEGVLIQLPRNQYSIEIESDLPNVPVSLEREEFIVTLYFADGEEIIIEDTTDCSTSIGKA